MKLYLIRHAKTLESGEGKSQNPDAKIDASTIEEGLYSDLKIDKVYSSPLIRATATADLVFGEDNYETIDYIYEYVRPKSLDGKSREEDRKFWDWGLLEYRKDPDWKYGDSESFNEIKARAEKFLKFLNKQKDTVVEHFDYPEDKEIEEFCKIAHRVIGDMGFEAKQSIVRKVVDTIVGTQHDIKVYGHLALNSSIIANVWKGGIQDVKFETSSRNSRSAECGEKYAFQRAS